MKRMPKRVYLFVSHYGPGSEPQFALVTELKDIPEDRVGETIGEYVLEKRRVLQVTKELVD